MYRLDILVKELKDLIPHGFNGACWGYDFDWEARLAKIPAYQITGHLESVKLVEGAAEFERKDLKRMYHGELFCFSYSPFDQQQVFNASMKGARVLAQAYSINKNQEIAEVAKQATAFVISHQKENGSWDYSLASAGGWTDNYHTGYILDCLDEYQKLTGDCQWKKNLSIGYKYYLKHFIENNEIPRFYDINIYPIDCTSASQTIMTTLRFGNIDIANKVANWIITNMQKKNGSFTFRKFKNYTIKTSFMRWSDAWMFLALS